MWFKRRKKTEQDHLLSESLRSLQTLLSESSGRLEPNLDPRHTQIDMDSTDKTDSARGKPSSPGDDTGPENSPAPESGNRWRDLSLNFDAEPATPRLRRGGQTKREPEDGAREPPAQPHTLVRNKNRLAPKPPLEPESADLEQTIIDETGTDHAEIEIEATPASSPPDAAPEPPPEDEEEMDLDIEAIPVLPMEPGSEATPESYGEPAVEYFDRAEPAAKKPMDEGEDASTLEIELSEVSPDAAVNVVNHPDGREEPSTRVGKDQLHLELEPAEDDIPTLTDAVYIPDAQPDYEEFTVPAPVQSPYEEDVAQCLENLRVRLQLMGLDLLSTEQESELRDTLVEFLDERGFSTGGNT